MQENEDLLGPLLTARKNVEGDIETLLSQIAQRRRALLGISTAIETLRNLPERVEGGTPRRYLKVKTEEVLNAAMKMPGESFSTKDISIAMGMANGTSNSRFAINCALENSGLFTRLTHPPRAAMWRRNVSE